MINYSQVANDYGLTQRMAASRLLPRVRKALAYGDRQLSSVQPLIWHLLARRHVEQLKQALGPNYNPQRAMRVMVAAAKQAAQKDD